MILLFSIELVFEVSPYIGRNLAHYGVITDSDQLAIKNLIIHLVCILVDLNCIAEHETDKKTDNCNREAHNILQLDHRLVLFTRYLQEYELIKVLLIDRNIEHVLLESRVATLKTITLLHDMSFECSAIGTIDTIVILH